MAAAASSDAAGSAAELSRRQLLQSAAGVGSLYALAGRVDAAAAAAGAPLEKQLEQRVTEFTLSNGLHFVVSERHTAPIVSFHTYADVGAYDEEDGLTGEWEVGSPQLLHTWAQRAGRTDNHI